MIRQVFYRRRRSAVYTVPYIDDVDLITVVRSSPSVYNLATTRTKCLVIMSCGLVAERYIRPDDIEMITL